MFPYANTAAAARLGLEDVANDPSILKDVTLSMSYANTDRNSAKAAESFLEEINSPGSSPPTIGVVGERVSRVCASLTDIVPWYKVPLVSYGCTTQNLSNKTNLFFLRGTPSDEYQARVIRDLLVRFSFTTVATIYSSDEFGTSIQTVRRVSSSYLVLYSL